MPALTFEHWSDPPTILVVCGQLYRAQVYDPQYDLQGQGGEGLLYHYGRAHNEGETSLVDLWVAQDEGVPIGVTAIDRGKQAVLHLFVDPFYRRQGIGRALLQRSLAQWQGEALVGHYTDDSFTLFSEADLGPADLDVVVEIAIERARLARVAAPQPRARLRARR